eukprot:2353311-Pyramimonas_sp.AAC.1
MRIAWTRDFTGMRPCTPEVMMISLADHHTGIPYRHKLLSEPRSPSVGPTGYAHRQADMSIHE